MTFDPKIHNRRSIRLPGHDYAGGGGYFVTVCTHRRAPLFGRVVDGEMQRNVLGDIVVEAWHALGERYSWFTLDAFQVMPNHVHGVIIVSGIDGAIDDGTRRPLGDLVGELKMRSAWTINLTRGTPGGAVWQRNYYEHVIRGDRGWDAIRAYIRANPANWERDPDFRERAGLAID